ncbi:MAG TPA: hypothetical protein VMR62_16735 [Bryobacteraceae bacterium]|nr:hypothetical protein [Bryobacteraceae bacterium]
MDTIAGNYRILDPAALDTGQAWRPKAEAAPVVHQREFPVNNAVVNFP